MKSNTNSMVATYFKQLKTYQKKYGPKVILFWQCGSFFEIYGLYKKTTHEEIDSTTLSKAQEICDLTVSNKSMTIDNYNVKMGGVPIFSDLNKYIKKLINKGYTVPVWVQDPKMKTHRQEEYISTPGTLFVEEEEKLSNNIMCIWINVIKKNIIFKKDRLGFGITVIDSFTADVKIFQYIIDLTHDSCTFDSIERLCSIYNPNEILIIHNYDKNDKVNDMINFISCDAAKINVYDINDENNYNHKRLINVQKQNYQEEILQKYYNVFNIDGFKESLQLMENCYMTNSLCFLLDYVCSLNKSLIKNLKMPIFENVSDKLLLANHSLKQLNIIDDKEVKSQYSSIINMLNKCVTRMGKRQLSKMLLNPTTNVTTLNKNYDFVEYIISNYDTFTSIRNLFKNMKDIEIYNRKITFLKLTPKELVFLNKALAMVKNSLSLKIKKEIVKNSPHIKDYFEYYNIDLAEVEKNIDEISKKIQQTIDETEAIKQENLNFEYNFINPGCYSNLDNCCFEKYDNRDIINAIVKYLAQFIKTSKNANPLSGVKIMKPKETPMYLECTQLRKKMIEIGLKKAEKVDGKIKIQYKSTVDNKTKTFLLDPNLKFINKTGKSAKTKIESEQLNSLYLKIFNHQKIFVETLSSSYKDFLSSSMTLFNKKINYICKFIGLLDSIITNAHNAINYNYTKPVIDEDHDSSYFDAQQLRHPIIENIQKNKTYIANDVSLGKDKKGILLYGTNSVGKSSLIRSIGISIVMAQAGMYVPASNLIFKPYTSIYTRIIGNDNLFKGLSTFGVEMTELNNILRNCDENSLILGDELCSGTESSSAMAIFVGGLQHFNQTKSSHIFATHFHEILKMEEVKNLSNLVVNHMAVKYDREKDMLVYFRKLRDGPGNNTYGLEVCESLHLPRDFMEKCYNIRGNLEKNDVLTKKQSHYNSYKIKGNCEICGNRAQEIHHLVPQHFMVNDHYLHIPKNHPGNLLSVCKKCHDKFTKNDKKHIKVDTTKGTQLLEI